MSTTSAELIKAFQEYIEEDTKFTNGEGGSSGRNARDSLKKMTALIKSRHIEIKAEAATRRAARTERQAAKTARQADRPNP